MSTTTIKISVTVHPPMLLVFRVISCLDTIPIRQFNFKTQLNPPPPPRTPHNAGWETRKVAPFEGGAVARALQDLSAHRWPTVNAKRRGVRRLAAAFEKRECPPAGTLQTSRPANALDNPKHASSTSWFESPKQTDISSFRGARAPSPAVPGVPPGTSFSPPRTNDALNRVRANCAWPD